MDELTRALMTKPETPKNRRQILAEFLVATMQLVQHLEVDTELEDLFVTFTGRVKRVDISKMGANGHIEAWLHGLCADPTHPRFAEFAPLPGMDGARH